MRETWGSWHLLYVESRGDLFSRAVRSTMAVSGLWRNSTMAFAALWIIVFIHRVLCYLTMNMTRTFWGSICFRFIRFIPSMRVIHVSLIRIHRSDTMVLVHIRTSVMYIIYRALFPLQSHNVIFTGVNCNFNVSKKTNSVMCANYIGRNMIIFRSWSTA